MIVVHAFFSLNSYSGKIYIERIITDIVQEVDWLNATTKGHVAHSENVLVFSHTKYNKIKRNGTIK